MHSPTWLGEQLVAEGRLSQHRYMEVLMRMKREDIRIEEALLDLGVIDENTLLRMIAQKTRTQYLTASKLAQLMVSDEALRKLTEETARKLCCVPIRYDRNKRELSVVTPDAGLPDHVQQIAVAAGVHSLKAYLVRPAAVEAAIRKWYRGEIQAFVSIVVETFTQLQSTRDLIRADQMSQPIGQTPSATPVWPSPARESAAAPPAPIEPKPSPMQPPTVAPATASSVAPATTPDLTPVAPEPLHAPDGAPAGSTITATGEATRTEASQAPSPDRRLTDLAEMLHVLVALNENARDEFRGHSASVARLSRQVVQRMGMDDAMVMSAAIAANLHDLGKPVDYHLTAINLRQYATHRSAAQKLYQTPLRLLESIELPASATGAVVAMYERFDGQGFPRALKGKQIPVGGRVLALCDAYSDLTLNPRNPYRRMLTAGEALKVLAEFKGSLFDPDIVDILVQTIAGENLRRRLSADRPMVLLVEPAPEEATIMELRLVAQGFDVKVVRSGVQALEFVESSPVSFILSETELQPFDGFELLAQLRKSEATRDTPFIFVARASDTAAIDRAFALGAQDYVVKPTSGDVLAAKLRRVGGPKSQAEAKAGISGSLSEMGLPDLSQILSQGRKSGRLTLRGDGVEGEVHFESGQVVHAVCGNSVGQAAFYELLGVTEGSFALDPSFQPTEHTIAVGVESLVLEGLRRLDEKNRDGG